MRIVFAGLFLAFGTNCFGMEAGAGGGAAAEYKTINIATLWKKSEQNETDKRLLRSGAQLFTQAWLGQRGFVLDHKLRTYVNHEKRLVIATVKKAWK